MGSNNVYDVVTRNSSTVAAIFIAGIFRKQSRVFDQSFGVQQLKYSASCIARFLAAPFGAGRAQTAKCVPD